MIVSKYLPNRTTLALKNRYSALRVKTRQPRGTPKKSTWGPGAKYSPNRSNSGRETDDQTDDDDEEEDDEDDEDDDSIGAGRIHNLDWPENLPAKTAAVHRQASSAYAKTRSSSLCVSASSDIQRCFTSPSASVEQWSEEFQNPNIYTSIIPSSFTQNNYTNSGSHIPVLPVTGIDSGAGTASPNVYPYQPSYQINVPHSTLPVHNLASDPTLNIFTNEVNYPSQGEQVGQPINKNQSRPVSRSSPTSNSVAQQEYLSTQYQNLIDQALLTPDPSPGCFRPPEMATSSAQNLVSASPPSQNRTLHHVSVDAECTSEQLGEVIRNLVGLSKKVTVKVNS